MAPLWGKPSPNYKDPLPQRLPNNFPMPRERMPPRQRLAKNLKVLATKNELSGHQIAKKAGVDPKTVSNMMRASFDPRLSLVEKVAGAFGLAAWQILAYDMEARPPDSAQVARLL